MEHEQITEMFSNESPPLSTDRQYAGVPLKQEAEESSDTSNVVNRPLTEEQKQLIEEKRKIALAKRAAAIARNAAQKLPKVESGSPSAITDVHKQWSSSKPRQKLHYQTPNKNRGLHYRNRAIEGDTYLRNELPFARPKLKGSCSVVSSTRFEVEIGYHQQMIEVFRSVPDHVYDPQSRLWNFLIKDHDKLMQLLEPLKQDVFIAPLPHYVLKIFQNDALTRQIPEVDISSIEPCLRESLFPFQREGVCFGISKQGRVLIADDMGLGKTIEALGIAHYYRKEWPLLVIAPSSVRYTWKQAVLNWLPSVDPQSVTVVNTSKDKIGNFLVLIISYDLLKKMELFMSAKNFRVIIVDESHLLKNNKAWRTQAILPLLKNATRVILLSGTPALSRPIELFTQVSAIDRKLFPTVKIFGLRYCSGKKMPWGWDFTGASNMKELQHILEECMMIRRLKSDVIKQLPAKRREMIVLDPTRIKVNSKDMKAAAEHVSVEGLRPMEKRGALLEYFCKTGTAKINAVSEYVTDLVEAGKKFLCFAHHKEVLNGICNAIESKNCDYIRIDGSTISENRKLLCDKFQASDSVRVAVLSITAANMGISLTAAHLVVFAELFWNPGILTQAEDRVHRIGQEDSVLVQYLVAKHTADDYIWPLVQEKLDILNKAGLSKDNFHDADTKILQSRDQPTLDDFFKIEDYAYLEELDWNESDMMDDSEEQPNKRLKV